MFGDDQHIVMPTAILFGKDTGNCSAGSRAELHRRVALHADDVNSHFVVV